MTHAVRWYSAGLYPLYERMGFDEAKKIADAAGEHSLGYPLHLGNVGKKEFEVPELGKVSAGKCIAIMVSFLVWVQWKAGNDLGLHKGHAFWDAAVDGLNLWRLCGERGVEEGVSGAP